MKHHHLKKTLTMPTSELQVLADSSSLLGECPLWHPEENALYWIDITGMAVRRFDPVCGDHQHWAVPSEPGCIAWCPGSRMLVAMRSGIVILDTKTGELVPLIDAPYDPSQNRFNDGRCDASGRLWVGTLSDDRSKQSGDLFCLERGAIRKIGKPVTVSNGLAFSPDNHTLYHADTTPHIIRAYDFDLTTGTLGDARIFKQFSTDRSGSYGGRPDGAAVDSEGAYWCAMYEGGKVLRLSPSGEVLREIALPVRCPTMIAFGGPDLRTLYITTVRHKRPEDELKRHPHSGCVLSLRVDIAGRTEHSYAP